MSSRSRGLRAGSDDFELLVGQRAGGEEPPGRKTDVQDAEWVCQLIEPGLLRPSLVPPKPIRELRELVRYRDAKIKERPREVNRLQKTLEGAGIKLSSVASEVLGVSARKMLDALFSGTPHLEVLADLAKGALRKKIPHAQGGAPGPLHRPPGPPGRRDPRAPRLPRRTDRTAI